ncbi:flavin reductase family protein [Nocardioides houyundeii]|uniref:flavin reductase family protein n=1 Tax=Nocardioides houyundeii TaxID=2045452 RepID=UPI000DF20200|nr:flavin reductase family protein [Nocardioides houyundeii]
MTDQQRGASGHQHGPTTRPSPDLIEGWLGEGEFGLPAQVGDHAAVREQPPAFSSRQFRDVLGRFASGVTVVTSLNDGVPVGMTCQSFTSVSLDPPLVLFCPSRSTTAWPLIRRSGAFCVNVLAADQAEVSNTMATRGTDKFARVRWSPSLQTGSPVLAGVLAHLDCTIEDVHHAGDHDVVIGRVHHVVADDAGEGLLFFRGGYGSTGCPDQSPDQSNV